MSLLSGRKAYLPLEENKPYQVTLVGWAERTLEVPTESGITGFITFKWQLAGDQRIVTDNRSFPVGTDILATQVIQQLADTALNAIEQEDLFQTLIDSHTPLNMWVERRSRDDDTFTNYHFRELHTKVVPHSTPTTPAAPAPVENSADNFK